MSKLVTKGSDYALLLLSDLALQPEGGEVQSVHEMAERNQLPERFIANIVSKLIHAGILASKRGFNGGIQLARPSDEISFRDVIEAVEGPVVFMDCQKGPSLCCHEVGCSMKGLWGEIQGALVKSLEKATIGAVVSRSRNQAELDAHACDPEHITLRTETPHEQKEGRSA
ncbi:MAG: Rrf2 family transcriptional regulator [Deltaproteobacteria bacterium]|nr:Rrf2 family transcriptional regulator [Deltaproteobacteria bacterium]